MPLAPYVSTAPLLEGDSLTSEEFLRRWEEMPDVKHAELIDGIVYMPSPVRRNHGEFQMFLAGWLSFYSMSTRGCRSSMDATWLMAERQVPQPDLTLLILPEYSGQSGVAGEFHAGAPELIIEVAVSNYARDFGAKKRLYERMGVQEYLIVVPRERHLAAFQLASGSFQPLEPDTAGLLRSACFPGLWLDTQALWELDLPRMNAVLQQGLATPEHAAFAAQLSRRALPQGTQTK
jgi:Uma2 family endonuclease